MNERYLITGGAGFIGTNLAYHYLAQGKRVIIFDNFSRKGTRENVQWLQETFAEQVRVVEGDVRHVDSPLLDLVNDVDVVFHLAAQVAVTTSVTDPREDFEINALGTLNVLEAVRASSSRPIVLYSSTNKVYGKLDDMEVADSGSRYGYVNHPYGAPETRPLDFYSPYGCSKGAGDQYMIDYARIYGLKTVVFRQSCIYGPHQFGIEDQGWLAWFAIRALQGLPVTIFGDGKQVRDVLYIDDLIAAYDSAIGHIDVTAGRAYNIGGGPGNTLSILELIDTLNKQPGFHLDYSFGDWRPGDQQVFISDIRTAKADFGWEPRIGPDEGVGKLVHWLKSHQHLFAAAVRSL